MLVFVILTALQTHSHLFLQKLGFRCQVQQKLVCLAPGFNHDCLGDVEGEY